MRRLTTTGTFLRMAAALAAVILFGFGGAQETKPAPQQYVIEIRGFQFQALDSSLQPGDTVTWVNRDLVPHTATAVDSSWSTAELKQGERGSIVVTEDMQAAYLCRYHPAMLGRLPIRGPDRVLRQGRDESWDTHVFLR